MTTAEVADRVADPLIQVQDLEVHFPLRRRSPFAPREVLRAVDGVSFEIARGRTLGLVGESGCGKTTVAMAVLRLIEPTSGRVRFDGIDLLGLSGDAMRHARRRIQVVFQDPYSSLNPRQTVGSAVREPLDVQGIGTERERDERVRDLFAMVGLSPAYRSLFPHQFSGGQRQRIGIARALATSPDLVVCDEPVTSLDVAIRAQILNLLARLQTELGLSYLFISHDLSVIQHLSDEVAVMYRGRIVEQADRRTLFRNPKHPYTRVLLAAVPSRDPARRADTRGRIAATTIAAQSARDDAGCTFAARCRHVTARCRHESPELRRAEAGHWIACHVDLALDAP